MVLKMENNKIELRPELQKFAEQMEIVLRANDYKSGLDSENIFYFIDKFIKHAKKLDHLITDFNLITMNNLIKDEILDCANYLLAIYLSKDLVE